MSQLKLFERSCNNIDYLHYHQMMETKLNYANLLKVSKRKVKRLFDIKHQKEFLRYRFELLKQWMYYHEFYDNYYNWHLRLLIKKLFLTNELNAYEQEYINHHEGVVFAKVRNLKKLIIHFPLVHPKEKAYYKYDEVSLYKIHNKTLQQISINGEMYITTHRILLDDGENIYPIMLDTIKDYKVNKHGLIIFLKDNTFSFKTYDDFTSYVSFERILHLTKRKI